MSSKPECASCRLCMQHPGVHDIYEVDPLDTAYTRASRIMWVTQLTLSEDDGLPSKICPQCVMQLNSAYSFILQCLSSDKAIRALSKAPAGLQIAEIAPTSTTNGDGGDDEDDDDDAYHDVQNKDVPSVADDYARVPIKMEQTDSNNPWETLDDHAAAPGLEAAAAAPAAASKPVKYNCSICDGSFRQITAYISHIRLHNSEQPSFECAVCKRMFNCQSHLNRHARSHTGENPFKCVQCTKSFYRQDHLVKHVRSHTGERPFACTLCERSFSRRDHLSNHVKLHMRIKPYQCSLCVKSFFKQSGLTKHLKCHDDDYLVP